MAADPVDQIISAVLAKLQAHRDALGRSLRFGRVTWRFDRQGKLEVELDLKF